MAMETTAILRSILFQMMALKDYDKSLHAVKAMCTKDDIAAVEKEIAEMEQDDKKQQQK